MSACHCSATSAGPTVQTIKRRRYEPLRGADCMRQALRPPSGVRTHGFSPSNASPAAAVPSAAFVGQAPLLPGSAHTGGPITATPRSRPTAPLKTGRRVPSGLGTHPIRSVHRARKTNESPHLRTPRHTVGPWVLHGGMSLPPPCTKSGRHPFRTGLFAQICVGS